MEIIKKIHRLTDLPELSNINNSKLIVAYNRKNYVIDAELIAGKKIASISERASSEDGGRNLITIRFSDGTSKNLYVYNGSKGETGHAGLDGEKGETGTAANVDLSRIRDAKELMTIVNDYVSSPDDYTHDENCEKAWSAYRGKYANDKLNEIKETFVSDEEYDRLWDETIINYMNAEFTTAEENHETIIFANDTNSHTVFKKFWTYEEDNESTYYVAIYGPLTYVDNDGNTQQQLDDHGNPVIGIIRYDQVIANIWDDIYLGATEGKFPATTNQLNDLTPLYIQHPVTGEYSEITIDHSSYLQDNPTEANPNYKNKDFDFYSVGMEENLHAHFENQTKSWTYSFDIATPYQKPLYIEDFDSLNEDGERNLIEVTDYDNLMPGIQYYSSNDKNDKISDLEQYLNFSAERCYVKIINEENETYYWKEVAFETAYHTKEEKSEYIEYLKEHDQEFIILSIDIIDQSYTFERFYKIREGRNMVYTSVSEVYKDGNQPILYAQFDSREYYNLRYVLDKNTNNYVAEYTRIIVPDWIVAEFTTSYEDEIATLINSTTELGDEDNTIIDITAEDYEDIEDIDVVPIKFIAYSDMEKIYEYNSVYKEYDEVAIENINTSRLEPYYTLSGEWIELTGEQASEQPAGTELYFINAYGDKQLVYGAIDLEQTYYKWEAVWNKIENSTGLSDIVNFIKNQNITIFNGIPKQLPIMFYPLNATYKFAKIEYDSDIVTLFEDGRICAIAENLDENNETHTTITIIPIDPQTEHQVGTELVFDITILTPMTNIIVENDGERVESRENSPIYINRQATKENEEDEDPIDETINFDYIVSPITTSNKKLNFTISNESILEKTNVVENFESNTTNVTFTGLNKGKVLVTAEANDGFGANARCWIEVVEPVTNVEWLLTNEDGKPKVEKMLYDAYDMTKYMREHDNEIPPFNIGDFKEYHITLLKDVEYLYNPTISPENASYPELQWQSSNNSVVTVTPQKMTIVDTPAVIATEEDVDDGLANEVGETIKPAVTHEETVYLIVGKKITTTDGYVYDINNEATDERVTLTAEVKDVYGNLANDDENKHRIIAYVTVNQSVENITISLVEGLTTIELEDAAFSLNVGTSKKLVAELTPETAVRTFEWKSSDESIITIDENGLATAIKPGIAKIYANATDGSGKSAYCDITVTVPATNIDINSVNGTIINGIVYVGRQKTAKVKAHIEYKNIVNATNDTMFGVNWIATDPSIVSLESNSNDECTITGTSLGTTTIVATAKDGSGTLGTLQVVVIESISSIEFVVNEYTLDINDSLALMPIFNPENSSNQVLEWSSSDETIATVNNSGIVTALSSGNATITATTTDGSNVTAECNITIN